ncbi:MAG: response regulator [Proteobacteria bacterium]|nr:response regulator [Pseudomonadota bacterium]
MFLNLLLNAAQAIEPGDRANQSITVRVASRDDEVDVSITDSGSGIAAADLPRLFEPFFTTKPRGVGSGLGLSICQRIVGEFGGRLEVESTLGTGTTMTVMLLAEEPAPATPLPLLRAEPSAAGRLMVVDDDAAVLDSLKRLLQAGGHEVVALQSGEEALEALSEDDRFDLILTDLMMDGMSGIDLYEALDRDRPALARKLTFVSGGAFDQDTRDFLARVPNPQLSKPFELDSLLSFVAEQLAGPAEPPISSS